MSSLNSLKQLAGDSLIYGVSGIISRFLSVFLVPIYTRMFAPAEYGAISLVLSTFALLNLLVILGLDSGVARWYYDTDDARDQRISLNTFLWSCFSLALFFSAILFVFHDLIANRLFNEPRTSGVLLIAAVNLPLTVFTTFTWNLLRMQRRPVATAVFTVTTSLINIGLNLLFIVTLRWGISGIFYAQAVTSFVAMGWTLSIFRDLISWPRINIRRWLDMIRFSAPLIPGSIAFWVVNLSGSYFIQRMAGPAEVGLYQIGVNVASGMVLLTGAFQMAWGPFAFSIHKQPNAKIVYSHTLLGYLALTCTASLLLTLFSREILLLFTTPEYVGSYWVVGILSYNFVLIGLSYIASIGPSIAKNNAAFGVAMVISAAILVGLNLILVPRYGKEGAALSTVVAQVIVPAAVFWHGQRLYKIPYNFSRAVLIFGSSLVTAFGSLLLLERGALSFYPMLLVKCALAFTYCILMLVVFKSELKQIWALYLVNRKSS